VSAIDPELAQSIKVVVLDADGVLTDGGIYVADGGGEESLELRRFHAHDGIAVHMLRRAGITVAIVSGKPSKAVRERARALHIDEIHQVDPYGKLAAVEGVLRRAGATWEQTAFLGDDLADLPVMRRVGFPAAVSNAVAEIGEAAHWRGSVPGGSGAVRELAEDLLRARGEWSGLVEAYVEECTREWGRARNG
jgi:3-deoxy-D-manno-octulosonate 8-phosphate phosphatase (KDO 8-P phosphatase)